MPYIEVKARKEIDLDEARKIVRKGTITAVITTGKIRSPALLLGGYSPTTRRLSALKMSATNTTMPRITKRSGPKLHTLQLS